MFGDVGEKPLCGCACACLWAGPHLSLPKVWTGLPHTASAAECGSRRVGATAVLAPAVFCMRACGVVRPGTAAADDVAPALHASTWQCGDLVPLLAHELHAWGHAAGAHLTGAWVSRRGSRCLHGGKRGERRKGAVWPWLTGRIAPVYADRCGSAVALCCLHTHAIVIE